MKTLLLTLSKTEAEAIHRQIAEELPQTLEILLRTSRHLRILEKQAPVEASSQAKNLFDLGIELVCALQLYVEKNYPDAEWINLYLPEVIE